ncbi:estradiol 17-beta-dehydrogenase 8 [Diabrotica virgifera virgifera]|uniref:Ketoreductase domain-containing protein n=1 Tax=Diabrotica virgifera virgifera TaxID=50390 RepID=A0ABM5IIT1_DIAVI|nr:estradiol 17-beta-dehydrogenase 8 [Diabrotica virgifera virgifera]
MSLAGRLAFVTGAGSGIGRATCKLFSREGASVVVADKVPKTVEETLNIINQIGQNQHLGVELDVSSSDSVGNALKKTLEKYSKPPTVIVNCAGITRDNFLLKMSEKDFEEVLDINLKGTFLVMKAFANSIVEHGLKNASIVNISSIVGKYGNIGQANYTASKAGVELLSKTASKEFGQFGIRVNTIFPGMIKTRMIETVPDKVQDRFRAMIPMSRFGEPEEIAEVITFLATDKSSYVTGASIHVTGGF